MDPKVTHDNCLYAAADALDLTLHKVDGVYKGFAPRRYSIGGFWSFTTDTLVVSDSAKDGMTSFFVRFSGNLWGYLISTSRGLWLVLLDGDRAKLHVGSTADVGTKSIKDTLLKMKEAALDSYAFDAITKTWNPFDVMGMLSKDKPKEETPAAL